MKVLSSLLGTLLVFGLVALADTVSLTPVADTTISEGSAAHADGISPSMIVGHLDPLHANIPVRGLLRFDLSNLPSGAVVTSAMVRITVTASASVKTDSHLLNRLNSDWLESAATWTNSGLADWEQAGADFVPTPDSAVPVSGAGAYTFVSSSGLVDTVQMWLTNASSNHGWIIRSESEADGRNARRINTREAAADQPTLVLDYIAPADIVISNPRVANGSFVFDFLAGSGTSYAVQYKGLVDEASWTTLTNYPDPKAEITITVEYPLTNTNRFYRVITP